MNPQTQELILFFIGILLAVVGFLSVLVLNSIRGEIREIKKSFSALERDLREGVGNLDRRVTVMEHDFQHHENNHNRRDENGIH